MNAEAIFQYPKAAYIHRKLSSKQLTGEKFLTHNFTVIVVNVITNWGEIEEIGP